MARAIPTSFLTALGQKEVMPYYAVEMLFDSGAVRFWTGYGECTIQGETYTGAGSLLFISGLEETSDLSAKSATLVLSGIPSEIISLALQEPYQRRKCRILFGLTNDTNALELFSGVMSQMDIDDSAETATISLVVESKLVELEKSRARRYTHESQQARFPGDTFFSYVADLQDRQVIWGRSGSGSPSQNPYINAVRIWR